LIQITITIISSKNIEKQVKSGAELSAQLLGFSRCGQYDVKTTDINKLLKKSAEIFGRTKKKSYQTEICT